jgi:hypothetical protein
MRMSEFVQKPELLGSSNGKSEKIIENIPV